LQPSQPSNGRLFLRKSLTVRSIGPYQGNQNKTNNAREFPGFHSFLLFLFSCFPYLSFLLLCRILSYPPDRFQKIGLDTVLIFWHMPPSSIIFMANRIVRRGPAAAKVPESSGRNPCANWDCAGAN
jgi:hypothetical protein